MIILFTSNIKGGILQFTIQILKELKEMNYEVLAFIPQNSKYSVDEKYSKYIVHYKKCKTLNIYSEKLNIIEKRIIDLNPHLIWYCDNSILCSEMIYRLSKNNSIKQLLTMHDAGTSHLTNNNSLRDRIHKAIEKKFSEKSFKKCDNIVILSQESKMKYLNKYMDFSSKVIVMPLGAHVPDVYEIKPSEIDYNEKYFLFFGRIDKYKGILNMLKTYEKCKTSNKLIIAGNGDFSKEELLYIKNNKKIIVINRYIEDSEMIYLFKNSLGVILPYIEATQSGIIPIAYKYSKPVIISNIAGLKQFVVQNETGFICLKDEDYMEAIKQLDKIDIRAKMGTNCLNYYNKNLEWKPNIVKILNELKILNGK